MSDNTKYELTNETLFENKTIYQVKALQSFGDVQEGELGGWVESENNLAIEGECWIFGGKVLGNAIVSDSAQVWGNPVIEGNVQISGNAWVSGTPTIKGNVQISGNAWVFGSVCIENKESENIAISGNAWTLGSFDICVSSSIDGGAFLATRDATGGVIIDPSWVREKVLSLRNGFFLGTVDAFEAALISRYGASHPFGGVVEILNRKQAAWDAQY